MRVIAKSTLRTFWSAHPKTQGALKSWYADVSASTWRRPSDLRNTYATVSLLGDNRAVFNIMGNQYRLVVRINYEKGLVFIRFVGSHAEYDKIRAEEI